MPASPNTYPLTFATPVPIDLAIDLQVGRIEIVAGDRADTIVTVAASSDKPGDRRGLDLTTVDFDGERLTITGPRPRLSWIGPNSGDSVDITVELPSDSRLTAELATGGLRATGRLGATRVKCSLGAVELDATAALQVHASHGRVSVGTADGPADVTASYGDIRIGRIAGDAILKSSHGAVVVGESAGELDAKLSYGDLEIATALASVSGRTAYGRITLGEVSNGSVQLDSGYGELAIGVRPGVPAWLDLASKNGRVRNGLGADVAPAASEQTVSVRARTQYGDIDLHHAAPTAN